VRASEVQHRYVVIGVGAIGGCIGGVLARAGVPVVLVARGRTTEVLVAEDSTLYTPDGEVVARALEPWNHRLSASPVTART